MFDDRFMNLILCFVRVGHCRINYLGYNEGKEK